MTPSVDDETEDHDRGLSADLPILLRRRRLLGLFAGAGLVTLAGCGSTGTGTATASPTVATTAASATGCAEIPEETAGPFPGDGSNGPDALRESGVVRGDIRAGFGTATGVADGVPLTITLTVADASNGCAALPGAAVYLWHCDREGRYSLYSQGVTGENYLRGVQETDDNGRVTFTSIFPACYSGRWPHIHFEVYPSLAEATAAGDKLATSQIAMPKDVCETVYATDGYRGSVRNLARTSLTTDNVFSDGYASQLGTVTGSVADGYAVTLSVPVGA